jgi:hypothetical protein
LNDSTPEASELDEKNAMALAIVPVGKAFFLFNIFNDL